MTRQLMEAGIIASRRLGCWSTQLKALARVGRVLFHCLPVMRLASLSVWGRLSGLQRA